MRAVRKFGLGLPAVMLAALAFAAEPPATFSAPTAYVAVLQNGFSIRYLRQEARPAGMTRLHTSESDFVDVATAQISAVEPAPPEPTPPVVAAPTASVPQLIDSASGKHLVDADFIRSVILAESGFNPHAVSPKGAQGLMQLMPQTAQKLGVTDSFEPGANIDAGTRYLRELLVEYHGDAAKALAAYNAGPQRVEQYRGVPPYRETRAYVRRVITEYNRAKKSRQKPVTARQKTATRTASTP